MLPVKPLENRVLVKVEKESESVRASGIVLVNEGDKKPTTGIVKAFGHKVNVADAGFEVGQKVLFDKYSGTELKVGDGDYLVMKLDDVMGVLID